MNHQSWEHLKPLLSIPMIPGMVENSWHVVPLLNLCFYAAFALSDAGSTSTNIKKKKKIRFCSILQKLRSEKCWIFCKNLFLISFANPRPPRNWSKQREQFLLVFLVPSLLLPVTSWTLHSWKSSLEPTVSFSYWSISLLYKLRKGAFYPLTHCTMHFKWTTEDGLHRKAMFGEGHWGVSMGARFGAYWVGPGAPPKEHTLLRLIRHRHRGWMLERDRKRY